MYTMKVITTTVARKYIGKIVDSVKSTGRPVAIGRRNKAEVMVVRAPQYNPALSDVLNLAAVSGSFDFLYDEPDIYSDADVKWHPHDKKKRV